MNLQPKLLGNDPLREHVYDAEDADALKEILGRQYHSVVGNPPYITVKDKALNEAYRDAYSSCHMKYSLGVPFTERFFELAMPAAAGHPAGFVGMITANSFMKREFGAKLIEQTLPKLDLTHVLDTSGAYIPGHGTPTVILFGRNRSPVADEVRTVMGIRGEPSTPNDPAQGKVWIAISSQLDKPGSESDFVSVADYSRSRFATHPWSLGGGGVAELKELIESVANKRLKDVVDVIGVFGMTNADDAMLAPDDAFVRRGVEPIVHRRLVLGDQIRDWALSPGEHVLFPYDANGQLLEVADHRGLLRWLWPVRTVLGSRATFSRLTYFEEGRPWWEWHQVVHERLHPPFTIVLAFVATHNHFVLDKGGKVFNRSAPVIKLPADATEDNHFALLALLNSSTACFWMKQVMSCKGLGGQGGGIKPEDWHRQYEYDSTKLKAFPIPPGHSALAELGRTLHEIASAAAEFEPHAVLEEGAQDLKRRMELARVKHENLQRKLVAFQEELDWRTYALFGLTDAPRSDEGAQMAGLSPEMRPVERLLRSRIEEGESTIFYETQPFRGTGEVQQPSGPSARIIDDRLDEVRRDKSLSLIETLNYKRRWQARSWEAQVHEAASSWLASRLEKPDYWPSVQLQSIARLADRLRHDEDALAVATLHAGHPDFDVVELVGDLVRNESVPALPACRYTSSGLRKHEQWQRTWEMQRLEDESDARTRLNAADSRSIDEVAAEALSKKELGDIPVPPTYTSADFVNNDYWRLRGKLDVPKERFVSFPHCERSADPSLVIAWAGWNHLQLAQATASYYVQMKETEGWSRERLTPLLAVLAELLPWLRQWHNEIDPEYGVGMDDYFNNFVDGEMRTLGLTPIDLESWSPPKVSFGQRKKHATRKTV